MRIAAARTQRGDTIIEVMIVLAVLGLAIGLSYGIANSSLLNLRQSTENTTATELVRSQIENIRYLSQSGSTDPQQNVFITTPFCIDDNNQVNTDTSAGSGNPCYFKELYQLTVTRDPNTDTFKVNATWPDVRGDVTDSVTTYYRIHQ